MEIQIRPAQVSDVSAILEIFNYEIKNSTVVYHYDERSYEEQLQWLADKNQAGMPVLIAEQDNKILGFGTYGIFRPWEGFKFSVEHSVYVDKNSRGGGIGKSILSKLIQIAKNNKLRIMIAGIDASNEKSIQFHEQFGFYEVGTFREVGFKFDRWLDVTFMQLNLTESSNEN
ncbi:MAG: N-acetyltransferase family protein [Crocinitomicaceae bacterium]|nr:N-acetyltransferase family protein [Crocinitomicaceae bacterium]